MTEQRVGSGESPERVVPMGDAEVEVLVDFWCGKLSHFSRTIDDGLDYIDKLTLAAQSPFLGDMDKPHDLATLIDDANEVVSQIPVTRCKEYNQWLNSHPGEIIVGIQGGMHQVSEVAVSGYDVFPVIEGVAVTSGMNAWWLKGSKDK